MLFDIWWLIKSTYWENAEDYALIVENLREIYEYVFIINESSARSHDSDESSNNTPSEINVPAEEISFAK